MEAWRLSGCSERNSASARKEPKQKQDSPPLVFFSVSLCLLEYQSAREKKKKKKEAHLRQSFTVHGSGSEERAGGW